MPWQQAGIPQDAVEKAMERCSRLGRDAFRKDIHKGFKAAKGKRVMYKGRGPYEPRPLVAAAYAIAYPEELRLEPKNFTGDSARQYLLRNHGFTLEGDTPASDKEPNSTTTEPVVKLGGVTYPLNQLSETARQSLAKWRAAEMTLTQLKQRLTIYQTARAVYARELNAELPEL